MADFYFQLKDLAVGYHGNPLIRDINIGIDKGEIVTLIGPNGSGKSTILKSITRQLKLIGGTVFFDDTSLMELSYKELSSKMAVVLTERIKTELMNCHDIHFDPAVRHRLMIYIQFILDPYINFILCHLNLQLSGIHIKQHLSIRCPVIRRVLFILFKDHVRI